MRAIFLSLLAQTLHSPIHPYHKTLPLATM